MGGGRELEEFRSGPPARMKRVIRYIWAGLWSLPGLVLAPFFSHRRVHDGVLLCDTAAWPGRLGWKYRAITFGHVVLCVDQPDDDLLAHELAHVRQYERWGPLFIPAYLVAALFSLLRGGHPHRDNVFERAAQRDSGMA